MARATLVSLYAPCQAFTDHMSLPIAWDIKVTCTRLVQCQSKLAIEKNLSYRHHLLSISDLLEQIQFTTAIIRLDQINKRRRRHYLTWEETAISTHSNDAVRSVTEKSLLHWLNLDVEEIKKLIGPAKAARSQFQCHLNYFKQLRQVIARHSFLSEQSAGLSHIHRPVCAESFPSCFLCSTGINFIHQRNNILRTCRKLQLLPADTWSLWLPEADAIIASIDSILGKF